MNGGSVDMDLWRERVNQDITDIKNDINRLNANQIGIKDDIRDLQMSDKLQDQEISTLKATLSEIKEDTNFIRRKITGAIITAVITAICGGLLGIAIVSIFGQ
ncbi:hemolysin XhlA family protein [Sporosarcina sp. ACRSL]|uniref:hemolysin XhlA family protein n=1 Tax=Sporosarcina sp. ACRSL TaxID=2918215 RepID=UPI001EF5CFE9|nr:hemolysin XhlA family protein [Sporosarcina sp. ACRSL]MCG7345297.1 hemolysin XhlA family protein [Sporosarcina sp. ACRSL]